MYRKGFYLISAIYCLICSTGAISDTVTDEDRVFNELFKNRHYGEGSRPVRKADEAVTVTLSMEPINILEVDDLDEILRMLIWIEMIWTDFRLSWNESEFGGLTSLSIPRQRLWTPDIVLMNSAQPWKVLPDVNVIVTSNGTCHWFPPLLSESACSIDISSFPFDDQFCALEFESWSYDSSKLNLTLGVDSVFRNNYRRNSQWNLIKTTAAESLIAYTGYSPPTSHIEFTLHLKRRTLFYGFNLILPFSLLCLLAVVAFALPLDTGDRITLGITTFLAMSVTQLIVVDRVPPSSDSLPLMGTYFACVMIMNAASVIFMVAVSNLYNRSLSDYPMPNWVQTLVCKRLAHLLGMRNKSPKVGSTQTAESKILDNDETFRKKQSTSLTDFETNMKTKSDVSVDVSVRSEDGAEPEANWQLAALVIDRLGMYFCIAYIIVITLTFYGYAIIDM